MQTQQNKVQMRKLLLSALLVTASLGAGAQERMRVIIDNDFAGDPDGLFALAQIVESPSVDVRAIVCSHLHDGENWVAPDSPSAATAKECVTALFGVMGRKTPCPVVAGSERALSDTTSVVESEATDIIIREAHLCSKLNPLYVLCGGGLTEIASAWLRDRTIADRIVLVWIGGAEYPGTLPPPGIKGQEYNTTIDTHAAQVVFNNSDINMWQVPRPAYRQCIMSHATLRSRTRHARPVADYLVKMTERFAGMGKQSECYVLGDSPLVLLTALQTTWERDAASSFFTMESCPVVDSEGRYWFGDGRRKIRVYRRLDTYLLFEDMFAKMQ